MLTLNLLETSFEDITSQILLKNKEGLEPQIADFENKKLLAIIALYATFNVSKNSKHIVQTYIDTYKKTILVKDIHSVNIITYIENHITMDKKTHHLSSTITLIEYIEELHSLYLQLNELYTKLITPLQSKDKIIANVFLNELSITLNKTIYELIVNTPRIRYFTQDEKNILSNYVTFHKNLFSLDRPATIIEPETFIKQKQIEDIISENEIEFSISKSINKNWIQEANDFYLSLEDSVDINTLEISKDISTTLKTVNTILNGILFGIENSFLDLKTNNDTKQTIINIVISTEIIRQYYHHQIQFTSNTYNHKLLDQIKENLNSIYLSAEIKENTFQLPLFSTFHLDERYLDHQKLIKTSLLYEHYLSSIKSISIFQSLHLALYIKYTHKEELQLSRSENIIPCIKRLLTLNNTFLNTFGVINYILNFELKLTFSLLEVKKIQKASQPTSYDEYKELFSNIVDFNLETNLNEDTCFELFNTALNLAVTLQQVIDKKQHNFELQREDFHNYFTNLIIIRLLKHSEQAAYLYLNLNKSMKLKNYSGISNKDSIMALVKKSFSLTIHNWNSGKAIEYEKSKRTILNVLEILKLNTKLLNDFKTLHLPEYKFISRTLISTMLYNNLNLEEMQNNLPYAIKLFDEANLQIQAYPEPATKLLKFRNLLLSMKGFDFRNKIESFLQEIHELNDIIISISKKENTDDILFLKLIIIQLSSLQLMQYHASNLQKNLIRDYIYKISLIFAQQHHKYISVFEIPSQRKNLNLPTIKLPIETQLSDLQCLEEIHPAELMPLIGLGVFYSKIKPKCKLEQAYTIFTSIKESERKTNNTFYANNIVLSQFYHHLNEHLEYFEANGILVTPATDELRQIISGLKHQQNNISEKIDYNKNSLSPTIINFIHFAQLIRIMQIQNFYYSRILSNNKLTDDDLKNIDVNLYSQIDYDALENGILSPELQKQAIKLITAYNNTHIQNRKQKGLQAIFQKQLPVFKKIDPTDPLSTLTKLQSDVLEYYYYSKQPKLQNNSLRNLIKSFNDTINCLRNVRLDHLKQINLELPVFFQHMEFGKFRLQIEPLLKKLYNQISYQIELLSNEQPLLLEDDETTKIKRNKKSKKYKETKKETTFSESDSYPENVDALEDEKAETEFFINRMRTFMSKQFRLNSKNDEKDTNQHKINITKEKINTAPASNHKEKDKSNAGAASSSHRQKENHEKKWERIKEKSHHTISTSEPITTNNQQVSELPTFSDKDFPALPNLRSHTTQYVSTLSVSNQGSCSVTSPTTFDDVILKSKQVESDLISSHSTCNIQIESQPNNSSNTEQNAIFIIPPQSNQADLYLDFCNQKLQLIIDLINNGLHYFAIKEINIALPYSRIYSTTEFQDINNRLFELLFETCDFMSGGRVVPKNTLYSKTIHFINLRILEHTANLINRGPNWYPTAMGILMEVNQQLETEHSIEALDMKLQISNQCHFIDTRYRFDSQQQQQQYLIEKLSDELMNQRKLINSLLKEKSRDSNSILTLPKP